jgi:membrane-associated phospholipid phosphatase
MKNVANLVSVVFHPLLLTTILFGLLFLFAPYLLLPVNQDFAGIFILVIFLTTFVIPLISLSIFRATNMIPDFHMKDRVDRLIPFIFISIFYLLTTIMFTVKFSINQMVNLVFFTTTSIVILVTIFTLKLKISVHGAGTGGMIGFLAAFSVLDPMNRLLIPLALSIVVAGIVMSARLFLNAHTPKEVYLGTFLGFTVSFFSTLIFS